MDNETTPRPPVTGDWLLDLQKAVNSAVAADEAGQRALVVMHLMWAHDFLVDAQQDSVNAWRSEGATWADVGQMFGISRQAAHKAWS